MRLHEYQTKIRFAEFNVPTPRGEIAHTPNEAFSIAQHMGVPVVVKAQVLVSERNKEGGIRRAYSPAEAQFHAAYIFSTPIQGLPVHRVLIEPIIEAETELYLGITYNRHMGKLVIIASNAGGAEIETSVRHNPDVVIQEIIDPLLGLRDYQVNSLASNLYLPHEQWSTFRRIAHALYHCYIQSDATLAEINPLAITPANQFIALDGKMVLDDNALYRHPDLSAMRDTDAEPEAETRARQAGINYVQLDGQIGVMVNGAGLAMTAMDMILLYGDTAYKPANFLDIGGGAQVDQVETALKIILDEPSIQAILCNIFGGNTRCDEVAKGILAVYEHQSNLPPLVVRLQGTNAQKGLEMLQNANIENIYLSETLTEAARKVIQTAHQCNQED